MGRSSYDETQARPWKQLTRMRVHRRVDTHGRTDYRSKRDARGGPTMNVLVIGGGGREHALVWKLRESLGVEKVWCAPGNGGIASEAECLALDAAGVPALVEWAEKNKPDLTVV